MLKAAARCKVAKKAKGDLPGVALAAPAELATAVAGSTAGVGGAAPSFGEAPRKERKQSHSVLWIVADHSNSPQDAGQDNRSK